MKKFKLAVVAGTFDHLHSGHLALLKAAKQQSRRLVIGLTSPEFVTQKTLSNLIEPFSLRKKQLLTAAKPVSITIVALKDPIGPAATNPQYDAIFASPETKVNVNKVNLLRVKNGLKPLRVVIIKPVKDSSGQVISSSHIRAGLVSRKGMVYSTLFRKSLSLPQSQRRYFKSPLGPVMSDKKVVNLVKKTKPFTTIAIGDIAVMTLINQGLTPDVSIIDLKTRRKLFVSKPRQLGLKRNPNHVVANPPGTITPTLVKALLGNLKNKVILVGGEEDLAVLPAILLSPLTSAVIYGQPDRGLVYLAVTEELKAKVVSLLKKFT